MYKYGSKKMQTKIVNNSLFVRQGGGLMTIVEFHKQYGALELEKQRKVNDTKINTGSGNDLSHTSMQLSDKKNKSSSRLNANGEQEILDEDEFDYGNDTEDGNNSYNQ